MITSMVGSISLRRFSTSTPDMPVMRMSRTATWILFLRASSIAAVPSLARWMLYSSLKTIFRDWRGPSSSSTINNVGFAAVPAGGLFAVLEVVSKGEFNGMADEAVSPVVEDQIIADAAVRPVSELIRKVPTVAALGLADARAENVAVRVGDERVEIAAGDGALAVDVASAHAVAVGKIARRAELIHEAIVPVEGDGDGGGAILLEGERFQFLPVRPVNIGLKIPIR